jgi:hypothetical protein
MRRSSALPALILLGLILPGLTLLCLFALAAPAAAQTAIHRCVGANGNPVFTDQPCAALGATPVAPGTVHDDADATTEPPPILCAASRDELRQGVVEAFASRDANRMAGLMLWDGYGRAAVITDIRALAALMKQPLLDIDAGDDPARGSELPLATAASAAGSPVPDGSPAATPVEPPLVLHTAGNDGSGSPRELRFDVVRRAGCLWLRSAD